MVGTPVVVGAAPNDNTGDPLRTAMQTINANFALAAPLAGTTTNDNAAAGGVGEYIEATRALGAALALTTTVPLNVTSISLTAGDWDVSGVVCFTGNVATTVSVLIGSVSSVSATLPTYGTIGRTDWPPQVAGAISSGIDVQTGLTRFSLAATTTIYLVGRADFAVNSASAFGHIRARRVR